MGEEPPALQVDPPADAPARGIPGILACKGLPSVKLAVVLVLQGYHAVWSQGGTVLECIQDTKAILAPWFIPTAVVVSFIVLSILIAVALMVWLRMTVQLRRKWQREQELMKNRLKGVPNGGPASIVVTDVESYSGAAWKSGPLLVTADPNGTAGLHKLVVCLYEEGVGPHPQRHLDYHLHCRSISADGSLPTNKRTLLAVFREYLVPCVPR